MRRYNLGTMHYMSPERQENHPYSFDADIWSLGLTVLHLATVGLCTLNQVDP